MSEQATVPLRTARQDVVSTVGLALTAGPELTVVAPTFNEARTLRAWWQSSMRRWLASPGK
ncbi:MAG: hypothetical protein WDM85_00505 [Caulobacteraceae bacterium]